MRLRVVTPLRARGLNSSGWGELLVIIDTAIRPTRPEVPKGTTNQANDWRLVHPNHLGICSLNQMHNSKRNICRTCTKYPARLGPTVGHSSNPDCSLALSDSSVGTIDASRASMPVDRSEPEPLKLGVEVTRSVRLEVSWAMGHRRCPPELNKSRPDNRRSCRHRHRRSVRHRP